MNITMKAITYLVIGIILGGLAVLFGTNYYTNYSYCKSLSEQPKYPQLGGLNLPKELEDLIYKKKEDLTKEDLAAIEQQKDFTFKKCMAEQSK